jgi:hypothetical protein
VTRSDMLSWFRNLSSGAPFPAARGARLHRAHENQA